MNAPSRVIAPFEIKDGHKPLASFSAYRCAMCNKTDCGMVCVPCRTTLGALYGPQMEKMKKIVSNLHRFEEVHCCTCGDVFLPQDMRPSYLGETDYMECPACWTGCKLVEQAKEPAAYPDQNSRDYAALLKQMHPAVSKCAICNARRPPCFLFMVDQYTVMCGICIADRHEEYVEKLVVTEKETALCEGIVSNT